MDLPLTVTPVNAFESILPLFENSSLKPCYSKEQGRYIRSRESIPADTLLFVARGYANGVFPSWRKRQCDVCWRQCNGVGFSSYCKQCRQVYFCSTECQKLATAETSVIKEVLQKISSQICHIDYLRRMLLLDGQSLPLYSTASFEATRSECDVFMHPQIDVGCHKYECEVIRKMSNSNLSNDSASMVRILLRIVSKQRITTECSQLGSALEPSSNQLFETKVNCYLPTYKDFSLLCGVDQTISYFEDVKREFKKLLQNGAQLEDLLISMYKTECNAFGLYNTTVDYSPLRNTPFTSIEIQVKLEVSTEGLIKVRIGFSQLPSTRIPANFDASKEKMIGRAVFPTASYFNHSCQPNAAVHVLGSLMLVYSRVNLQKNDEVTINYVDILQPKCNRQEQLRSNYGFQCNCTLCMAEASQGPKLNNKGRAKKKNRK